MSTQKRGRPPKTTLWNRAWRSLIYPWKFITWRNFRILINAIKKEPPEMIFENFRLLLRRGVSQSVYPNKFIHEDSKLKAYLWDCRKEAGILKVKVWVLAKHKIDQINLAVHETFLPVRAQAFIYPEFAAFFSEYTDFEQKGFLLQVPYKGAFGEIQLCFADREGHQLTLPIGDFFQYEEDRPELNLDSPLNAQHQILIVLHDWGMRGSLEVVELEEQLAWFSELGWEVIICTQRKIKAVNEWTGRVVAHEKLNELLLGQEGDPNDTTGSLLSTFSHLFVLSIDTLLPRHFQGMLTDFLTANPIIDILYFDEDIQSENGKFHSPSLKPGFSPEYLVADNYIGPNYMVNTQFWQKMGGFSSMDFIAGGYHFLLRALEATANFARLPEIRIHRLEQSLTYFTRKQVAEIQARSSYFTPKGIQLNPGLVPGTSEVLRPVTTEPLVSIIIPFKDQKKLLEQCLSSIFSKTQYPNFEILLISNNSQEENTYQYLEQIARKFRNVRWYRRDHVFNYSRLNNWAAQQANGAFLMLLNNDVEVITKGWMTKMLTYFMDERVGAAGAKLLYPDGTIQHAGIVTGIGGIAGHPHKHYPGYYGGYDSRANKVQNMSACTAACLMIRRSVFEQVGGFDEKNLPVAFNDVDLCLKIFQAGYRIVYTPFVQLFHYESISRGAEDTPEKQKRAKNEVRFLRKKWRDFIKAGDPYYHPELSKRMGTFEDSRIFGI